ncbi:MAG: PspC domain-containing protein [Sphingobacteriales bacterium]|jgi:phage shock protein PspC (stress-responsive transcriptional regulator)|nr:PspC domain-containing protein [Sphingobacteriales bacterium]
MNKTVTVNIGGIVFHIEEQAYAALQHYLESVRKALSGHQGADEILQDIESRMAEMFNETIKHERQVVTLAEVNSAIEVMGSPAAVAGNDNPSESYTEDTNTKSESTSAKRLFRDPDDKVISGVCSGLGHYLGVDPLWFRLFFVTIFLVAGSGLLLYILLALILPKARTTAEKLEMKGQPVNASTIRSIVEEEVRGIGEGLTRGSGKGFTGKISRFFDLLAQLVVAAAKFIFKLVIGFFTFILSVVLIALFIALLAMAGLVPVSQVPVVLSNLVLTATELNVLIIALGIVLGIPIVLLFHALIRRLFKLNALPKSVRLTALSVWIFGVLLGIFSGVGIAGHFAKVAKVTNQIPLAQPMSDTLNLASLPINEESGTYTIISEDDFSVNEDADSIYFGSVQLDIRKAKGDVFELTQSLISRGSDQKEASRNATSVRHSIEQNGDLLSIGSAFGLPKGTFYRGQKIRLVLYVPVGKSVYLDESSGSLIHDIQNVSNTLDEDMPGRVWTMTPQGLTCIGCSLPEDDDEGDPVQIRINGVDIHSDSIEQHIDTLKAQDLQINIKGKKIDVNTGN